MGTFSFVSFIITLSIILTNEFDGIDAGRPKDGKKPLPPTVDWRARGAVTPIKDQGNCGSDYAYAPVAVCEALYFFKTRKLISLSAQQMIDCTSNSEYFNLGCDGGWPESVLDYMVKKPKHGLEPDSVYGRDATKRTTTTTTTKQPYHHRKTTAKRSYKHATTTSPPPPQPPQNPGVCKYDPKHVVLNISRWNYVSCDWDPKCPHNDEKEMARAVDIAPIVVYFYSSCDSFRNYDGGFYQDEKCCSNKTSMDTDHGMTIVGYGTDEHKGPYWILKNSWGTKWGEKGYMRIKRGVNLCGIATTAIAVHA